MVGFVNGVLHAAVFIGTLDNRALKSHHEGVVGGWLMKRPDFQIILSFNMEEDCTKTSTLNGEVMEVCEFIL